ncbi:MAG: DUF4886 domain-containing protein [Clostridia bacterium]|nr:DUF4886 domain-containing protein [Clostridia bacterium]
MKRFLSILLVLTMLATLSACGGNQPAEDHTDGTTTGTEAATTTTAATTTAADTTGTEAPTTTAGTTTATNAPTTTTATKAPTTTTTATKAPTTTTTPKNPGKVPKSIKILAVGNSFSVDAMRHHLYDMLAAAGCTDIRLGILYIGGASLDTHYDNIRLNRAKYQYQENVNGSWTYTDDYLASDAFALTDWDIVTVQQVSGHSGRGISYNNLDALVDLIRPQIGDAKLYWHMTWAYQQDSTHADFGYYNKDQSRMYRSIVRATNDKIVNNEDFAGIIPSGTTIQNLRTSSLGDTLTADGYHLLDSYGDYAAALTWFCFFTGADAETMTYCPLAISNHFDEIAEAVNNAMKTPLAITACQ